MWPCRSAEFEVGAAGNLILTAGGLHGFTAIGDEPLVQLDVHLSLRFVQENLGC